MQDDFVLGKKLGEGAFGVVYRVSLAKNPSDKVQYELAMFYFLSNFMFSYDCSTSTLFKVNHYPPLKMNMG